MEHKSDGNTFETVPKGLIRRLEDMGIRGRVETVQTTAIVEIGQNTEKSPGDLRRIANTQTLMENLQLNLV